VTERSPTIAGAALADPYRPVGLNGVPYKLMSAFEGVLPIAGNVDASMTPVQRALVAARTFHPRRERWREHLYKNALAHRFESSNSGRRLRALDTQPDLVIQFFGLFRTEGVPYVVYTDWTHHLSRVHWPEWSPFGERELERWYALERRLYTGAAHMFPWSPIVAEDLVSFYGVPPERVTTVGVGANFEPVQVDRRRELEPVVLFVAREWRRKGGDVLVEAMRTVRERIPDARLRVVGMEGVAPEPGLELLGRVEDRAEIARLYAEAAVFCLPSRVEPFGLSAWEAMAHAVPCVLSGVGGMVEAVEDGRTALVVPPGDAEALAAALLRLLEDRELAARVGEEGRRYVASVVNWDRVVRDMTRVIRTLG